MSTFYLPDSPADITCNVDAISWEMPHSTSQDGNGDYRSRPKYRVLIIEDDPHIARLIGEHLIRGGLEARVASSGVSGLQDFQNHPPHLVLLDLMMPVLNGLETYQNFRREGSVPIVLMTARLEPLQELENFRHGLDDYVLKPFDPQLLVVRVIAHLRKLYRYQHRHIYRKNEVASNHEAGISNSNCAGTTV